MSRFSPNLSPGGCSSLSTFLPSKKSLSGAHLFYLKEKVNTRDPRHLAGEIYLFFQAEKVSGVFGNILRCKFDWISLYDYYLLWQMTLKWPLMTFKWPWMTLQPQKYFRVLFSNATWVLILFCIFISSDFISKWVISCILRYLKSLKNWFL